MSSCVISVDAFYKIEIKNADKKNKNSKRLLSVLFALNMIVSYDQLLRLFSYKEIDLYGPMSNSATQNKKQTHESKINYHSKSSRI